MVTSVTYEFDILIYVLKTRRVDGLAWDVKSCVTAWPVSDLTNHTHSGYVFALAVHFVLVVFPSRGKQPGDCEFRRSASVERVFHRHFFSKASFDRRIWILV